MPVKKQKSKRSVRVSSAEGLQKKITENPEIQMVLEIAIRAREVEGMQPARAIGIATDVAVTPSNAQCPV